MIVSKFTPVDYYKERVHNFYRNQKGLQSSSPKILEWPKISLK